MDGLGWLGRRWRSRRRGRKGKGKKGREEMKEKKEKEKKKKKEWSGDRRGRYSEERSASSFASAITGRSRSRWECMGHRSPKHPRSTLSGHSKTPLNE